MEKVLLSFVSLLLLAVACSNEESEPYIKVQGTAIVKMPVEYVKFKVGLSKSASGLQPLVKQSHQTMLNLKHTLLKEWGIPDSLVMTNESSITQYRYRRNEVTYRFVQMMTVTLDSLDLYETLRRKLIEVGANEVKITKFGNFNKDEYKKKALHKAYKNAFDKAKNLSSTASLRLGNPQAITTGRYSISLDASFDLNEQIRTHQKAIAPGMKRLESTLIKKFKKVNADIRVKFGIK